MAATLRPALGKQNASLYGLAKANLIRQDCSP